MIALATRLAARVASVAAVLLPSLEALNELDEVGRLLGALDEAVLEQLARGRAQERVALEAQRDKLAERARERRVERRWRVSWDDEQDLSNWIASGS